MHRGSGLRVPGGFVKIGGAPPTTAQGWLLSLAMCGCRLHLDRTAPNGYSISGPNEVLAALRDSLSEVRADVRQEIRRLLVAASNKS